MKGECLTLEQVQVIGDLQQDHEAGQDEAHRALQALVCPLTSIRPVPLALLHTHSDSIKSSVCLRAVPQHSRGTITLRRCLYNFPLDYWSILEQLRHAL